MRNIEEHVRKILELKNMSVKDLSKNAKIDPKTIYNLFNAKNPSLSTIDKIADALDTSTIFILTGQDTIGDLLEQELIQDFRELNFDNKKALLGELSKLLRMQNLDIKKDL